MAHISSSANGRSNILLVDDRPENLMALEAVLAPLDQNLVSVTSGEEALREILKRDFAVILLDVQMPGTDGFETAALIRQREKTRHVPILFVTAIHHETSSVKKGFDLGAFDYFTKPFDPDVLRAKVRALVDVDRADRQLNKRIMELEGQIGRMRDLVTSLETNAYRAQQMQDEHSVVVELREANQLKDDLFAVVAHEFRNPLGIINGLVHTLRDHDEALDDTQRGAVLDSIERQARRLSSLVENLLDGRRSFVSGGRSQIPLRDIIEGAHTWVRDVYPDSDVEVSISVPPDTYAAADPTAMHLVFVNLLSNAVKFSTPGSKVTVGGRTDGRLVTISIANAAETLTDEQREDMFKPFIRLEGTEERAGVGLGLHIVKRFTELYGGTVTVGSSGGVVTFTVQVPAAGASKRVVDLREEMELEIE